MVSQRVGMAHRGFTLIELVVVLVIVGVLAAVAVPRFIDLSVQANRAAATSISGALSSAGVVNFAAARAGSGDVVAVGDCVDAANTLAGGLPEGYTIEAGSVPPGDVRTDCIVSAPGDGPAVPFTAIGVAP